MRIAQEVASMSYAKKLKVGAIAVRDRRILCTGYNGTPPRTDNLCEAYSATLGKLVTLPTVEHAERNLIYHAARSGILLDGASLYITHSPCIACARGVLLAGFKEVYYNDLHKEDGIKFLSDNSIIIRKIVTNQGEAVNKNAQRFLLDTITPGNYYDALVAAGLPELYAFMASENLRVNGATSLMLNPECSILQLLSRYFLWEQSKEGYVFWDTIFQEAKETLV